MLDMASQPAFDKHAVVGGCVRLPLRTESSRLRAEVGALPDGVWGTTAGRVGVHSAAEAVFLRGHAPAEGDKPIEDRPVLGRLPYIRSLIHRQIPAPPLRALIARLPAGAVIPTHVDRGDYFSRTLRIHLPVETNDEVWMLSAGKAYRMRAGEVWALNNSAEHGVRNGHASLARTHLICDFLPTPALLRLVAEGDHGLGRAIPGTEAASRGQPAQPSG